jgi:mono/diheme cytochrome c family protein
MSIRIKPLVAAFATTTFLLTLFIGMLPRAALAAPPATDPLVARGRYVVAISGCNDCHTPGYAESGGTLPEKQWLQGSAVGFLGPWGVSYPSNLRITLQGMNEAQWMVFARAPRLPPMPWFALRDMADEDLRAVYRYVRSLGVSGARAPAPLAPGLPVKTPVIEFVPRSLTAFAAK